MRRPACAASVEPVSLLGRGRELALGCLLALAAFLGSGAPAHAECPNEAIRIEQGSQYLPDCRAYEQVSPVDKFGQKLGWNVNNSVDLTVDPNSDRVAYKGIVAIPPAQSASNSATTAWRTPSGWQNLGLFPAPGPLQTGFGLPGNDMSFRASAPDQQTIALWNNTAEPLGVLEVRRADGSMVRIAEASTYSGAAGQNPGQAYAVAFSPDGTRLYFSSNRRIGPAVGLPGTANILYEWVDDGSNGGQGSIHVVNRTNDEALTLLSTAAAEMGGATNSNASSARVAGPRGLRNAASDGSDGHHRVFFQNPAPTTEATLTAGQVYMREDSARTVHISAPEGANPAATQLRYLDASEDGRKAFFWSGSKLTDDPEAGAGIYRYDVDPNGPGDLVFLAAADPVDGAPPSALASPDGRNVLFTDGADGIKVSVDGVTAPVAPDGVGKNDFFGFGTELRDDRCPTASVTPDGRYFVFAARPPGGGSHIKRYDVETGELKTLSNVPVVPVGPQGSDVPDSMFVSECDIGKLPRYFKTPLVSDDGKRVFFSSSNALTADDVSPEFDAYEWFDDGSENGRVSVISRSAETRSSFLATSANGDTAYIMSSTKPLAPSDGDEYPDIYAVRINGGFATPAKRTPCEGDGCQGAGPSGPRTGSPATAADAGTGNAKDRRRKAQPRCKARKRSGKARAQAKARCTKRPPNQRKSSGNKQRAHRPATGQRG